MGSQLPGKQIEDGAITTAKIAAGALSADANGRAKFATDFFDETTVTAKFADASIAKVNLKETFIETGGGATVTADIPWNSKKITGLANGTDPGDAVNKSQLDAAGVAGANWKEELLLHEQLLDGASGGVLQGMALYIATNPTANDTFILEDGAVTETFTFKGSESVPFDVAIGGSAAATMTNLVAAINDDSTLWSAKETTGLDAYFAAVPAGQIVVYRTAVSTNDDRIFGSQTDTAGIKVVEFATGNQNYQSDSATESDIPAADPSAKRFGFGRAKANVVTGETHNISETNATYIWDEDDEVWNRSDAGAVTTATPTAVVKSDQASAAQGSASTVHASDATLIVQTATAVAVGTANAQGSSEYVSRADHVHDSPAPTTGNKEITCSVTASDFDAATAATVAATPALDSYVKVEVNGMGVVVGDGVKTKDCFFSGDGGTNARAISAIVATDTCHWVGSVAGYELAATDRMDWFYIV